jgi:hypothetical protein
LKIIENKSNESKWQTKRHPSRAYISYIAVVLQCCEALITG